MGTKRLNKEFKLDVCDSISLKYGSVNRDNPRVVYVSGKCWLKPLKTMEYGNVIENIKARFVDNIKSRFLNNENFDNKFIVDFDVNTDKMNHGEKKFMSFDFYLRQNEQSQKSLKELKPLFSRKMNVISRDLVEILNENDFQVTRKKSL